ncbi:hypothetical protein MFUR16E_04470 [Methylobacterium fujisawaense]|uniref:hypothetical protein n=1 Tax=Methylobacterium fujisawaense TaxID=107400 RepID=UPI002F329EA2
MPVVDRERSAELMAKLEAAYASHAEDPGADGALSRAWPAARAFQEWFVSEIERGLSPTELLEATSRLMASHMSTVAASTAEADPKAMLGMLAKLTFVYALQDLEHGVMGDVMVHAGRMS